MTTACLAIKAALTILENTDTDDDGEAEQARALILALLSAPAAKS